MPAGDRFEIGPALEPGRELFGNEAHQTQELKSAPLPEVEDMGQFVCQDRPHPRPGRLSFKYARVDHNEVAHLPAEQKLREAKPGPEEVRVVVECLNLNLGAGWSTRFKLTFGAVQPPTEAL